MCGMCVYARMCTRMHVCVHSCVYTTVPVKVRRQFAGVSSLLIWVLEMNSGHQVHWQATVLLKASLQLSMYYFNFSNKFTLKYFPGSEELIKLYSIYVELSGTFVVVCVARYFN